MWRVDIMLITFTLVNMLQERVLWHPHMQQGLVMHLQGHTHAYTKKMWKRWLKKNLFTTKKSLLHYKNKENGEVTHESIDLVIIFFSGVFITKFIGFLYIIFPQPLPYLHEILFRVWLYWVFFLIDLFYFILLHVFEHFTSMYAFMLVSVAHRHWRGCQMPREQELWVYVSHNVGVRNWTKVIYKSSKFSYLLEPSLLPSDNAIIHYFSDF